MCLHRTAPVLWQACPLSMSQKTTTSQLLNCWYKIRLTIIFYKLENLMIKQSSHYPEQVTDLELNTSVTCWGRTHFTRSHWQRSAMTYRNKGNPWQSLTRLHSLTWSHVTKTICSRQRPRSDRKRTVFHVGRCSVVCLRKFGRASCFAYYSDHDWSVWFGEQIFARRITHLFQIQY
jgi:hypothetical protein